MRLQKRSLHWNAVALAISRIAGRTREKVDNIAVLVYLIDGKVTANGHFPLGNADNVRIKAAA